jgi:hypothetical protein
MSSESNGSRPIHRLVSENIGQMVDWARNFSAAERERVGAANEPQVAVLRENYAVVRQRYERQRREAEALADACRQGGGFLSQAGYFLVAAVLTLAGFGFALVTMRPFNFGLAGDLFCVGLAILLPYAVDCLLEHFRSVWWRRLLVATTFVTAVVALVSLAEVRGDVMAHYLNAGAAVVIGSGGEGEPPPGGGDEQHVFLLLRRAMIFAALAFELAAGLAFFAFREARRNNDQGRRDRLEKEINRTVSEMLTLSRQIHELLAAPSRQDAEFWQQFQQDMMVRINSARLVGIGVIVLVAVMSATKLQAADHLQVVAALDLSHTQAVAYGGRSEFEENRDAIAVMLGRLPPGARVTVIGITDQSYVNPHILLSAELTDDPGYFGSRLNAARRRLLAEWQKRSSGLSASFKATDILGALRYGGEVLARGADERKVLAIFSDGRNCTAELDLETPRAIAVGPSLARLRKQGLVSSLKGVEVFLFGAGDHCGKRGTGYTLGLKGFWAEYIKEAGGNLVVFSTTRDPHSLQLVTTMTRTGGGGNP